MREGIVLGVEDEVDVALPVQRHVLGPVRADMREAHRVEHRGRAAGRVSSSTANSMNSKPWQTGGGGRRRAARAGAAIAVARRAQLFFEQQQRAHAVDRGRARRRGAEFVVEDLERDRPVVAARQHVAHEARHRQRALSGEVAEMPAPRQRSSRISARRRAGRRRCGRRGCLAIGASSSSIAKVWKLSTTRPTAG